MIQIDVREGAHVVCANGASAYMLIVAYTRKSPVRSGMH